MGASEVVVKMSVFFLSPSLQRARQGRAGNYWAAILGWIRQTLEETRLVVVMSFLWYSGTTVEMTTRTSDRPSLTHFFFFFEGPNFLCNLSFCVKAFC